MGAVSSSSQPKIGTLSFPVYGQQISDNINLIVEAIHKRRPTLLLCAGWTVPTEQSLEDIIGVTRKAKTIVLVETTTPKAIYFRIADGHAIRMGEQFFSTRKESGDGSSIRRLAAALPERSFKFRQRATILLNCGEVMVVQGRDNVRFHRSVPQVLQDAVRAPDAIILNPTHTRMGNCGSVQAWRKYLSEGGRVFLSASNWDVLDGQRQSATLHSFWYDGVAATATFTFENERICYREWDMPASAGKSKVHSDRQ